MASGNVDLAHEAFAAWQSGRVSELAALLDPNITWDISEYPLPDFPNTGSGRDAFQRHLAEYASGWLNYEATEVEVLDFGDDVVGVLRERVTMHGTDVAIEHNVVIVWTVDGERLTRFRVFKTREEALAALRPGSAAQPVDPA